jgi:hypothetical protein
MEEARKLNSGLPSKGTLKEVTTLRGIKYFDFIREMNDEKKNEIPNEAKKKVKQKTTEQKKNEPKKPIEIPRTGNKKKKRKRKQFLRKFQYVSENSILISKEDDLYKEGINTFKYLTANSNETKSIDLIYETKQKFDKTKKRKRRKWKQVTTDKNEVHSNHQEDKENIWIRKRRKKFWDKFETNISNNHSMVK